MIFVTLVEIGKCRHESRAEAPSLPSSPTANITCPLLLPLPNLSLVLFVTASLPLNRSLHLPLRLPLHRAPNQEISPNGSPAHPLLQILISLQMIVMTPVCPRAMQRKASPKEDRLRSAWPRFKALELSVGVPQLRHPSRQRSQSGNHPLKWPSLPP